MSIVWDRLVSLSQNYFEKLIFEQGCGTAKGYYGKKNKF